MPSPAPPTSVVSTRERGIETVSGIGPTRAKVFRNLGVKTLGDLLEYFPRDYQLETSELSIRQLTEGPVQTVRGTVCAVDYIPKRPRPRFEDDQRIGLQPGLHGRERVPDVLLVERAERFGGRALVHARQSIRR